MAESDTVMLPTDVRPTSYKLVLAPDLSDFTFRGEETVRIEVVEPTAAIVLNCTEIEVQSCRLIASDGSTQELVETSFDEDDETVIATI